MQKLIHGLHRFQTDVFSDRRAFFEQLAKGQAPEVLLITCSDSRIDPNLITQCEPGELFIVRNAGNIVPPHGATASGEAATIEYAVAVLKVKDIIICGHSHCGAMKAILDPPDAEELPAVTGWLGHADATRRIIRENYGHLDGAAKLMATIEENVLVQLENLRTLPVVAAALSAGRLHLHAWVYKIESGEVFSFDPESEEFLPVDPQRVKRPMRGRRLTTPSI
ncbi:MAG: carbonic anhydrase [Myxococcales bacterium]|nr:carbonic anhydrase [Myxococcales bacterium]